MAQALLNLVFARELSGTMGGLYFYETSFRRMSISQLCLCELGQGGVGVTVEDRTMGIEPKAETAEEFIMGDCPERLLWDTEVGGRDDGGPKTMNYYQQGLVHAGLGPDLSGGPPIRNQDPDRFEESSVTFPRDRVEQLGVQAAESVTLEDRLQLLRELRVTITRVESDTLDDAVHYHMLRNENLPEIRNRMANPRRHRR